jgi:anti-sigma B factor antagonist
MSLHGSDNDAGQPVAPESASGVAFEADGLRIERTASGPTVVYRVSGEIDTLTAPHLDQAVESVYTDDGVTQVVLDLTDVPFLSSAGLSVLADHHRRCGERGIRLSVVATHRTPLRALQITALDRLIPIYPSTAEALRDA